MQVLFLTSLALVGLALAQNDDTAPTVTIEAGRIQGTARQLPDSTVTVNQYLGVPFARPPINDLRFSPPQAVESWDGILEATEKRNACMQFWGSEGPARTRGELLFNVPTDGPMSEDCLYLDIYVPRGGEENKSVLFWIHGGSGIMGSAVWPDYDGTNFAANQDVIVVATNYRLNVFGNPRGAPIPIEDANLGQLDTNMALNWTARNIAQFGGDPSKITVMGESAGAISVGNLVNTSPDPLFRAAIEMSGSSVVNAPDLGAADPDLAWPELLGFLNCTGTSNSENLQCVRDVPAETLRSILEDNAIVFSAIQHNNITSLERPDVAWAEGNVAKVPLLIGFTADDGSMFVQEAADTAMALNLTLPEALVALNLPVDLATLIAEYYTPGSVFAGGALNTRDALYKLATDITFACTSEIVANLTSHLLDVPAWLYVYDARTPSMTWDEYPDLGVYHTAELPLLFGTYSRANGSESDASISAQMQRHFGDFIKDPQAGPGWEQWPQIGMMTIIDGQAATGSAPSRQYNPVCAEFERLWMATELSAVAQSPQFQEAIASENEGSTQQEASSAGAKSVWSSGLGVSVVLGLSVMAII